MARVITLADFRPGLRADGVPWVKARIEQADDPAGEWDEVDVLDLDPLDENPAKPDLRSFTVSVAKDWVRPVFMDAVGGEDCPLAMVYVPGPAFRPTADQVAAVLRARTYSGAEPDPDNPMAVLAGGDLLGEFSDKTRPSSEDIEERLIPAACEDVERAVGRLVPGELLDDARRIAAIRTAAEAERSYIPEQADEGKTIYQTLRLTFGEQATALRQRLQWWALTKGQG